MKRTLAMVLMFSVGAALAVTPEERIHKRVEQIRDSDTDAWRKIPWTATLLDAARAADKESRPMFIFSHEGNLDTGRC